MMLNCMPVAASKSRFNDKVEKYINEYRSVTWRGIASNTQIKSKSHIVNYPLLVDVEYLACRALFDGNPNVMHLYN